LAQWKVEKRPGLDPLSCLEINSCVVEFIETVRIICNYAPIPTIYTACNSEEAADPISGGIVLTKPLSKVGLVDAMERLIGVVSTAIRAERDFLQLGPCVSGCATATQEARHPV
jgi:hypothetical protein